MQHRGHGRAQAPHPPGGQPGVDQEDQVEAQQRQRQVEEDLRGVVPTQLPAGGGVERDLRKKTGRRNRCGVYKRRAVSLEGRVGENGDSQEEGGNSAANVGDDGQDLLVGRVHRSSGDVLRRKHSVTPAI